MAAIGTVLSVAHSLYSALNSPVVKEVCSTLGYKSHLKDLEKTVETANNVLIDAAASRELTHTEQGYIEELKAAVYDADDLFDEFRTLAEHKQQQLKDGHQLSDKVRLFFSSDNPLKFTHKMSREIKKISKNLEGIAGNRAKFPSIIVSNNHIKNRREETCSYVYAPNVIGREADVEAIVDKLLDLNGDKAARFLTIVGMGGMGKTTLAQLVCDDQRVKERFSSNVWWVCVADQENNQFDRKAILRQILDLATGSENHSLSLEQVQKKLRQELEGKKYLLVLDDLWNENKEKWAKLKEVLMLGAAESRIMVTTRSHGVANAIEKGDQHKHVLEGLSDENSWRLFEMTAFEGMTDSKTNELEVEIGKKIVEQCSNVPLAIKVVGSLLCGQGLDMWQTIEKSGLGGIHKGDNDIMSILKFSYHNLDPSLKSCFTYCASFPKDHRMKKEMLIRLWMAQGYIVPFHRLQTIEDAGEEHFLILLRRCFFQDVRVNKHGNVRSFKMHDLIHDVAQQVAGQEMLIATSETINLGDKARHVFEGSCLREENFYSNVKVRSYLRNEASPFVVDLEFPLDKMFTNGECLRTLTLVNVGMKTLPDSIGKLLHLRYLDLSDNEELKTLPGSITKLHNLQTLKLRGCKELRELPKNLSTLVNLMHLNIKECDRIEYMPVGMDKLTSLCELTNFVVADESSSGDNQVGQLKDLKPLAVNLKGSIRIKMLYNSQGANLYDWEGSCFKGAEHLQAVHIDFRNGLDDCVVANDEALWEKLFPPRNVTKLKLEWYNGVNFQRWGGADYKSVAILPNLVSIEIDHCSRLKHLPMLSKLKYLKSLRLSYLDELEYIDEETSCSSSCAALTGAESKEEAECTLFPCLESLSIWGVPKLKGMFSRNNNNDRLWQRSFPRLETLTIAQCDNFEPGWIGMQGLSSLQYLSLRRCIKLKSMPKWVQNMRSLKRLDLKWCSDELERRCREPDGEDWPIIKHIPDISFPDPYW